MAVLSMMIAAWKQPVLTILNDSFWAFVRADAYCSGTSAFAKGTVKQGIFLISITITLTCPAEGKLS